MCSFETGARITGPEEHDHLCGEFREDDHAGLAPDGSSGRTDPSRHPVLAKNDLLAKRNRAWLQKRRIFALNLMSSSGAGKTTLIERTLRELGSELRSGVIETDQETLLDADRLGAAGCRVVQINTGAGCHLDADMLEEGLRSLQPPARSIVFIENVGSLACAALFDLGEARRVVLASVTEGEDKPLKYPNMFGSADLVLLSKTDLLDHLAFDVDEFITNARAVNSRVQVVLLAAAQGVGMPEWCGWLREQVAAVV